MKIVMIIASALFAVNAFALFPGEKFDFNTGIHPVGANLGNVCFTDGVLKVIDTGSSCTGYTETMVNEEDGKVRIERSCNGWVKNPPKTVAMKRSTCVDSSYDFVDLNDGKGLRHVYTCHKVGTKALPRTQRLDTYYDNGTYSERQNSGSAMYTIPDCK